MGDVDPRDSAAVTAAVAAWARERFGSPVEVVGSPVPITGGLDSYIHTLDLRGDGLPPEWRGPLIVRLMPSVDRLPQAEREAAIQGWARGLGYPVPSVLAVLRPDEGVGLPTQVMERAPGRMMMDMAYRPWRIGRMVDWLAELSARLHGLPPDDFPVDPAMPSAVEHRLRLPRRAVAELQVDGLPAALEQIEAIASVAMAGPQVACHGDLHPLNVLVADDRATVIDWTNALLGPREVDVGRSSALFQFAEIGIPNRFVGAAVRRIAPRLSRRFERSYAGVAPLDLDQLARWKAIHTVEGWAQVELLRAGAFEGESSSTVDRVPAHVVDVLKHHSLVLLAALT